MPSDAYCHEAAARADAAQHADAWSDADDQPTRAEQTEEQAWQREQTLRRAAELRAQHTDDCAAFTTALGKCSCGSYPEEAS